MDKLQADLDEIKKIFGNSELQSLNQNPSVHTEVFLSHLCVFYSFYNTPIATLHIIRCEFLG